MIDISEPIKCPKDGEYLDRVEESSFAVTTYRYDTVQKGYYKTYQEFGETTIHFECPECQTTYSMEELEA
jgi:hypothetical protein